MTAALRSVDAPEHVVRAAAVGLGATGLVMGGVVLVVARQHLDRTVERRREQQRLARLGSLVEQAPDLGEEAHVGHAVGFVDDDHLDVVELERTLAEQVGEPAGTRNEHVDAAVQAAALAFVADPAVDRGDAEIASRRERLELTTDLGGELAGRGEDEGSRLTLARLADPGDERHAERDGLAGAGGRAAADVAAARASGIVAACTSKGSVIPRLVSTATRSSGTPRSVKEIGTNTPGPRHAGSLLLIGLCTHSSAPTGNDVERRPFEVGRPHEAVVPPSLLRR